MKLSDILNGENTSPLLYGVEVDCECLSAPPDIQAIGLMYQSGKNGLSENLMDAIITFNLAGITVILEIPYDVEVDASYMLRLASNAGFSISLIPPAGEVDMECIGEWGAQCAKFVSAFLSSPNFTKHIYPVQGYFTYLIAEQLGKVDSLTPTDEYVIQRFTSRVSVEHSDQAKSIMRDRFRDICGGDEGIKELAVSIVTGIGIEAERMISGNAQASHND